VVIWLPASGDPGADGAIVDHRAPSRPRAFWARVINVSLMTVIRL
jgi:hypothetical protein